MTHPIGSIPIHSPNEPNHSDQPDHAHSSEHQTSNGIQSLNTLGFVDDYLFVPQDAPLNERPALYTSGDLYTLLATSQETNFAFNAFDFFVPPGGGPPPHIHNYEHEAFFVEEGSVNFFLGDEAGVPGSDKFFVLDAVPAGTLIFGPRLRPHGFSNPDFTEAKSGTNKGARILSLTTPGGLDFLFGFAGEPVKDRNDPIPAPPPGINPAFIEFGQRTGYRGESFPKGIAFPGYTPREGTPKYVLVLPDDAPAGLEEKLKAQVAGIDGFSIWTASERPKISGPFGVEYTSLTSFAESADYLGNHPSYNQFSLAPKTTNTFASSYLNRNQVVEPTESLATGTANVQLNQAGELEYKLTVTGLDFGELVADKTPQTLGSELDDVIGIHIYSGKRGSNGSDVFSILDPVHQDETELSITLNPDKSATISGVWNLTEKEIPTTLSDFVKNSGLPGQESEFYFEIDTEGNKKGDIRGQIARSTNDFPTPIKSENSEVFYVREGELSFKINNEVRLAQPDTFVYVAPGNEYSFGNFGTGKVESLAVSITPAELEPVPVVSPLKPQTNISPKQLVFLSDGDDFYRPNKSGLQNTQTTYNFHADYETKNNFKGIASNLVQVTPSWQSTNAPYDLDKLTGLVYGQTDFATGKFNFNTDPTKFGLQGLPTGSIVLQGSNDDKLFATDNANGMVDFEKLTSTSSGTYTLTGGEGKFKGATGTLNFSETGKLSTNPSDPLKGEASITGSFQVPGSKPGFRIYAGEGNDELYATEEDRVFGEEGNDLLDASSGKGYNLLDGGEGNDILIAGSNDQLVGGDGDDTLIISKGGGNLLYGDAGADQFWIANGRLPDAVADTRQQIDFGLLPLSDTKNTIADFEQGIDKIYIQGISGVSSFNDLKLLPVFGDIRSTSIIAQPSGINGEISLANVTGVLFNQLSAADFVFS
ncbi:CHRD domain-containing protein [Nostoc sp. ChiVER01]|uniref:CHRD domain-containing protein n=1 Tax=Nostoc sp. ChiVER01 TaxID=3075382 RepID=UPI002AD35C6F|nr:CHRD domain-containing protein [Nostoc sp. ChiVER01]MDZ8225089.1 CHRD domain-containing protein [Nostoc sp. ChiVER01]